ncbi:hypothetical protein IVB18_06260 [Bradyrhizobium sp. 186]|uniref:ABC-three component system protein n=1 Tax=Bradyrhizobium sp. 186 TaxID=2782654 RepID=UPI00200119EC|nr:ABC-three component system protein [Bradyrhizobium sp. 186]UPK36926.1 hypothetical protein IVB18_06260 [Bradyrhizobium sp. 186]
MSETGSPFSAAEQGLGYIFQPRFALLRILALPEDRVVYIERNDDVEFVEADGRISLASLKHKAQGDRLSDLSTDFWKSVRIWLAHYKATGRAGSSAYFLLFTTAVISTGSFLEQFADTDADGEARAKDASHALAASQSKEIAKVKADLADLSAEEAIDFYARITIFPDTPRIDEIPELINQRLITVRRQSRQNLFERLEGWWLNQIIEFLTGKRTEPIKVQEVTDKLAVLADEYKVDNLPITFGDSFPASGVDAHNDPRRFVEQLRALKLSAERIRFAIIDYYRAFEQRSSWARANLLVSDEIEKYQDKLVDEWARYRELVCENITDESAEEACIQVGRELYKWAEQSTGQLRIRERVAEPYVVRGTFHILANDSPRPRVHWHPHFLQRLAKILETAA